MRGRWAVDGGGDECGRAGKREGNGTHCLDLHARDLRGQTGAGLGMGGAGERGEGTDYGGLAISDDLLELDRRDVGGRHWERDQDIGVPVVGRGWGRTGFNEGVDVVDGEGGARCTRERGQILCVSRHVCAGRAGGRLEQSLSAPNCHAAVARPPRFRAELQLLSLPPSRTTTSILILSTIRIHF